MPAAGSTSENPSYETDLLRGTVLASRTWSTLRQGVTSARPQNISETLAATRTERTRRAPETAEARPLVDPRLQRMGSACTGQYK